MCPVSVTGRYLTSISVRESPFPSLEKFWNASGVKRRRRIRTGLGPRAMKASVVILWKHWSVLGLPSISLSSQTRHPWLRFSPQNSPLTALPPAASLHFVLSTLGCGDAGLVLAGISGHLPRPAVNSLEQDCASGFSFTLPAFCSLHLVNCLPQSCGVSATWQGRCKDVSVGQFPLRPQPQQLHLELYCGLGFHVKCHLKQRGVLLKSVKTSSLHSWISEALVGGTYCSHLLAVCAILQHGSNPSLHD